VLRTLAFKSRLLLLKIFKINVLEVLWQLALYATIGSPETSNITQNKSNRIASKGISII
jgi:amino acid permease